MGIYEVLVEYNFSTAKYKWVSIAIFEYWFLNAVADPGFPWLGNKPQRKDGFGQISQNYKRIKKLGGGLFPYLPSQSLICLPKSKNVKIKIEIKKKKIVKWYCEH